MIFSKFRTTFTRINRLGSVLTTVRVYSVRPSKFDVLKMPKDAVKRMQELQKQRSRIKMKATRDAPSFAYLQVMGQGNLSEPRSVFLCTDNSNYLFNCGEGTQRLAAEHHAKLAKTENVFITRPMWNNIGGLPGVVLTIQETGIPLLHLHGPKDSIDMIQVTENFMTLNDMKVQSVNNTTEFKDNTMSVKYVLIQKPANRPPVEYNFGPLGESINFYAYQMKKRKRSHSPNDSKVDKLMAKEIKVDDLAIFICTLNKKLGKLDVHKCIELNVPAGALMGKLKAGEDVTLDDGTVVKSEDVVSPAEEGPSFIVLECPDEEYMDLIIKNQELTKYQDVACIVHFTPAKILNNPKYKEWMHKFGLDTMHLIINEENTGFSSTSMYKMQHQLHLIHPTIFPIFYDEKKPVEHTFYPKYGFSLDLEDNLEKISNSNKEEADQNKDLDESFLNEELKVRHCKTLDRFYLRSKRSLNTEKNIKIDPNVFVQETMEIDGFLDSLAELQTEISAKTKALGENIEEYPKLLMLGTGSSIPNKVRNTSGILFQVDKEISIILDCGESTVNQIIKFFGKTKADEILKTVKAVYISHLHADHHLGLIGLLEYRQKVTNDPIFLIATHHLIPYIWYYHKNLNRILESFKLINIEDILKDKTTLPSEQQKEMLETLNISNISTVFVKHCPFASAVAITLKDGRKICYSGDTMPCDALDELARDSFLLIHEATMEDALESDAKYKRHSTISQAIMTGTKANANFTLLTHFSQRYCKLPLLPEREESSHDYSRVGVAYDFMLISLSELPLLPLFYKTLKVIFNEFRENLCQKAIRRNYQQQLLKSSN